MRRFRFKVALGVLLTTSLVSLSSMAQTREAAEGAAEGATKAPAESEAPASKTQAQNSNTATSATSPTKPAASKPAATKKNTQTAKPQDEVFIPSEEISEDFAVSFPVDI